jgi:NADPH2:quinone reductase
VKSIRIHRTGGPEVLELDDLLIPAPEAGQARVAVEAAGVNFIDVYHRTGLYPLALPAGIGREGAGVVEAVGSGVRELAPGDRVAWAGVEGSYASHVIAPVDRLVPVPDAVPTRLAAAAMLQGMTAHYLTRAIRPLSAGDTCLVHAAAGGVGLLLCQLGRLAGARVLGTASTEAKADAARAAGAEEVIRYDQTDFASEVLRRTGDAGVDVVYDGVGRTTFDGSLRCLGMRGMMVLFGQASGPVAPIDPAALAARSLFLTRPSLFHYIAERGELLARARDIFALIERGDLQLAIDRELPLAEAGEAHRLLERRATSGKLLLTF